ncbi:zinc ABC transporter substrate-binding protein AztC [Mesorhizobium xinjiangense]|uniref:zinc ABC transporter substrate-binding protein AztC n=1 Tax=Mesorhizobium xinjiangense TaxID=2678685 RepID=UPI0012EE8A49|nr:zinc ABC transporter substrate-binding protein AztC [Mesorhizobium xinjiangense]
MRRIFTLTALAAALSCSTSISAMAADKLQVVASFSIIADLARNVGGERIDLTTLVGPDGDAHVYEPRPQDAAVTAQADIVLVNGLQFEGFLQRLVEASGTKAKIVELSKGVETLKLEEHGEHEGETHDHAHEESDHHDEHRADEAGHDHDEAHEDHHHHGEYDPHAWQSVENAEIYVRNITEALCAADDAGCNAYKANADAYLARLETLDADIRAAVEAIPEARRTIITSHDAFGYFEHAYGIRFLAPEGVSTESEASAADVAALIRQVREDQASAIFVENVTNPRLIEQIAGETGLELGGSLYSDALSDTNGPAATYIEMMKHNITTIAGAISGS